MHLVWTTRIQIHMLAFIFAKAFSSIRKIHKIKRLVINSPYTVNVFVTIAPLLCKHVIVNSTCKSMLVLCSH